jgi:hypothetical protein
MAERTTLLQLNSTLVSRQSLVYDSGTLSNLQLGKTLSVNSGTLVADTNDTRGASAWKLGRASTCKLGLLLLIPKARAHTGLDFGLSLQSRPQARKHGEVRPSKTQAHILQARPGPR